jgi:fructokinase
VPLLGGIEAGGTRWNCAVGTGDGAVAEVESFATTSPAETIARAIAFFRERGPVAALGVGCFGPVDLDPASPRWGWVTTTPKSGWTATDVAGPLHESLGVPVAFETDVGAAAVGEGRWGAGRGLESFCYVTVGTGIGAGVVAGGVPLHGLVHPEPGHVLVPHDRERDPFPGCCPYHGDCLEGLASGEALRQRWGAPGEELRDPAVWDLEAEYLAAGFANLVLTVSPRRLIVGGGVGGVPGLLDLVRPRLAEALGGYLDAPELGGGLDEYLVAPVLGPRSGVVGALELARAAIAAS